MRKRIRTCLPAVFVVVTVAISTPGCASLGAVVGGKPMPKITVERARLQSASVRQVAVRVDFTVENPYSTPLPALGLDYQLWLTGVQLAQGTAQVQRTIPARGRAPMSTVLVFGPLEAVKVAARLAFGKRGYRIQGVFRVRTPFGDVGVRYRHRGKLKAKSLIKRLIPGLGGPMDTRPQPSAQARPEFCRAENRCWKAGKGSGGA